MFFDVLGKFSLIPEYLGTGCSRNFPSQNLTAYRASMIYLRSHDSSEYLDWNKAKKTTFFAELKPSTKPISLRMPESMLERIKVEASKRNVPYQSLC